HYSRKRRYHFASDNLSHIGRGKETLQPQLSSRSRYPAAVPQTSRTYPHNNRGRGACDRRVAGQKSRQQDKNCQRARTDARSVGLPFETDQADDQVIAVLYDFMTCQSHNEDSLRMRLTTKCHKIIRSFFALFLRYHNGLHSLQRTLPTSVPR